MKGASPERTWPPADKLEPLRPFSLRADPHLEDIVGWGVWLGRYIFERIAKVSKGGLSGDRNPTWSIRAKVHLIQTPSTGLESESLA